ncbi:muscarinic acetylcholine receptor [Clonorchis sinensis]|uniref:Muscarinic acetylcholine receptor n=1 Tax=Clonorchis sinensis TaxID=79923 RepID=H2KPF8_CLOSI|nr:muscarinic acetylcholine receptor [Clonorchis sinensis]
MVSFTGNQNHSRLLFIGFSVIASCCSVLCESNSPTNNFHTAILRLFRLGNIDKLGVKPDVSEAYMRWSEWQRERINEKLRNLSGMTQPSNETALPQVKQLRDLLGKPTGQVNAPVTPERTIHISQQKVNQIEATSASSERVQLLPQDHLNFTSNEKTNVTEIATYTTAESVIMALLTVIASFITISGNILVLLSFFVERALRTATNYFIASLAVTDVLIGLFSMNLYTLYLILGRWPLGRLSCDLWLSLDYTACLTSQYTVLFITVDRFFSVSIPAKYRNWRTDGKVGIMVAATWLIPSSVFFTIIIGWPYFNTPVKPRADDKCFAEFANDPIFNTVFTVCYFWVTLCVMIGLYVGIYRVADNLQKRSDEKRNRVSGLITQSTAINHSQASQVVTTNQGGNKLRPMNSQPLTHNSAGGTGTNESSGFDSEEEQQKRINTSSNNRKGVKLRTTDSTYSQPPRPAPFANVTPHRPPNATQNTLPPLKKSDNCPVPTRPPTQVSLAESPALNPKPPQTYKMAPLKRQMECLLHPRLSITQSVDQSEQCKQSPAPICVQQQEGLLISSPILTDDESGLEFQDSLPVTYLPPSPALCICSDLEDEQVETRQSGVLIDSGASIKQPAPNSPKNHLEPNKTTENSNSNTKANDLKIRSKTAPKIPPVEQQSDPAYQNRVLEAFRRRMAANNIPLSESQDSGCLTSSNRSSQQPTTQVTRETSHHQNMDQATSPPHRTKCAKDGDSFVWNGELRTVDSSFSDVKLMQSSGEVDEVSVVWKPQPYSEMDSYSMGYSLHALTSYCDQTNSTEYSKYHPQCIICAGQNETDSVRSSSSYGEYMRPHLVERRICCCTTGLGPEKNRTFGFWPNLKNKFVAFNLDKKKFWQMVKRMNVTRQGNKAPVERGRRENRARKALRTITFILGAFVLCWTPYHVVIIIKGICDDVRTDTTCVNDVLYSITYWLCYMNSPINPFCYALANAQFKKTFSRILHGDFRRN